MIDVIKEIVMILTGCLTAFGAEPQIEWTEGGC